MSFMIGKKIGMTQIFDDEGRVVPVTVVEAGPMTVVQKKTVSTDGYNALKFGFWPIRKSVINKPDKGHFDKIGKVPLKYMKEYRTEQVDEYELGDVVSVAQMFNDR